MNRGSKTRPFFKLGAYVNWIDTLATNQEVESSSLSAPAKERNFMKKAISDAIEIIVVFSIFLFGCVFIEDDEEDE